MFSLQSLLASGGFKIVDLDSLPPVRQKKPSLKLPPLTAIQGGIGSFSYTTAKKLTAVVTHIVHSAEEATVLEMRSILKNTLPDVRGGLPLWVIWAYEVDLLLKKYVPNEAGNWCEILPMFRADFELLEGPIEGGLDDFPIETLANAKRLQDRIDIFLSLISFIKKALIAKHPHLESEEFQGLLKLLEVAEAAMRSSFIFPEVPLNEKDVSSQLSSLIVFLNQFNMFSNGKLVSKFKTLFPENLSEMDVSKERVIFENLCNAAWAASEGYRKCAMRVQGFGTQLNSHLEVINQMNVTLAENHGFVEAVVGGIHAFKIYHQLWKFMMTQTWSQERREWWDRVKENINKIFLYAGTVKLTKKDITSRAVQAVLKDPEVKDVTKSLMPIFIVIKEKREKCLIVIDGFHQDSNITLDFHNLYGTPFLRDVVAESLIQMLRQPLLNLEGHLQALQGRRKELFVAIRGLLQTIPLETLKAKKDKLIAHIRAFHIEASLPIAWSFQVLFQLSNLKLCQERYAFSQEHFLGDTSELPNEMDPLVDYLALTGLEKVFDQAIHHLTPKAAYVPPPQPQMATLERAVSHQFAKPTPAKVDVPKAPAKDKKPPAAGGSGAGAASHAFQVVSKDKKPSKTVGSGGGLAVQAEPKGEAVSDDSEPMRVRATSNDRKAVLKVLIDNGFIFWGFGGNHPLYRRGNERPVPVPLHSKTISHGVVHMLETAAAGVFKPAPTPDTKDQKRKG